MHTNAIHYDIANFISSYFDRNTAFKRDIFYFCEDFRLCPVVRSVQVFTNAGWQHGYVDPSADEGAADEADKVNLQVLCLTGE